MSQRQMKQSSHALMEASMDTATGQDQDLFDLYLKNLETLRKDELYKWDALVCFHQNWDLDAKNLEDTIHRSFAKAGNLLRGSMWYPLSMLEQFAADDPEHLRSALRELLDGPDGLRMRMVNFESEANVLLAEHNKVLAAKGESPAKNHYQDSRSMSVYLGFAHPDRYYLYQSSIYEALAVSMGETIVRDKYDKMVTFQRLCENVLHSLETSYSSIISASDRNLSTEQRAADSDHHLLVQDIAYFSKKWKSGEVPVKPKTDKDSKMPTSPLAPYGREDFLAEVYMDGERYDELVALLRRKHNIILQGAPGTGKTYAAKRLAWSLMGERDGSHVQMVQFHQSYSYEDFVIGFRPDGKGGFEVREGTFLKFCRKAAARPEKNWFFLIDEINRGNVSQIFGEMLMLIEGDHRGEEVTLALDGSTATVPSNVYVIGMMNTADRSLALIDYALRRRFGFFDMTPAFGNVTFTKDLVSIRSGKLNRLADAVKTLNVRIAKDPVLGPGFELGHSYFHVDADEDGDLVARSIVEHDLAPTLREYWYDDSERAEREISLLREAVR